MGGYYEIAKTHLSEGEKQSSSPEPLGQFLPKLAQSIPG